jgi:hypothetical protein
MSRPLRKASTGSFSPFICYPDADIVPCHLVDDIWHQHILDTIAYREDCDATFGRFLDHFPYFGMRRDDDAKALYDAYEDMNRSGKVAGSKP